MKTLHLKPLGHSNTAVTEAIWDKAAGTVRGVGLDYLEAEGIKARAAGFTVYEPVGIVTKADPLRTEEGLAVLLLSCGYAVPDDLMPYLPDVEEAPGLDY